MLKSDTLTVAFRDEIVVWRWRKPAPFEFLFMKRQAAMFFTKTADTLASWTVKAPHGAMAIATSVVTDPQPLAALTRLVDGAVLGPSVIATIPVWISDVDLDRMTMTDAQQALLGKKGQSCDQPFTLEI